MLRVKLDHAFSEGFDGGSFVSVFLIEGVDELDAKLVEGGHDLLEGALVSEVGLGGELDESAHNGGKDGVGLEGSVDSLEVLLDLLNLDEGR